MKPSQADVLVFGSALIGTLTYPAAQFILQEMDILLFHVIRFPLLALLFTPFALSKSVPWRQLWKAALPGIFFWLGIMAWSYGLMLSTHLGSAAFIMSLQSLLAPFAARLFFDVKMQIRLFIGLGIATVGLALLKIQQGFYVGDASLFMLVAAMFMALYIACNSHFARGFSAVTMSWAQFCSCAVLSGVAALFVGDFHINPSPTLWGCMAFMILISTGLRFTIMAHAQQVATASRTASILMLGPVMVAIMAWLFLSETLTLLQTLGCGLIFWAVLMAKPKPVKNS